jgi:16S rRNA C967 or C1407 C5-methylase (RsmB/RsmF family)
VKQARRPDFQAYYSELLGDRWPSLLAAMQASSVPVAFSGQPSASLLLQPYWLDAASLYAASLLFPLTSGSVLDMCAAPGGKTLVLASNLSIGGSITANERSRARRERLRRVLNEHLSPELRARVSLTGHDASRWGLYENERYDLVLLDAPCSSERHLVQNPTHLKNWSPARSRHLAQQAYAMLLSAVAAARVGGRVLYCTCALSPLENDQVVERALLRFPGAFAPLERPETQPAATDVLAGLSLKLQPEATRHGSQIWPDANAGAGPLYFSLLEKKCPTPLSSRSVSATKSAHNDAP